MTRADDAGDGRVFDIEITYFQDDRIWLATSDHIKGLTVEADSFQTFLETLVDVSADVSSRLPGPKGARSPCGGSAATVRHMLDEQRKVVA